jgi:hypothetical protein
MFRAARTCRRIHQTAVAWICHVEPSTFRARGPGLELVGDGTGVRQTKDVSAFALAGPVLRCGTASATFRLAFEGEYCVFEIGLFPADLRLDSSVSSADGKRCALMVGYGLGGWAQVFCDGVRSDMTKGLGWRPGDTVDVGVAFEGGAARVTLSGKGKTWSKTLQDVPSCGLRFGAGMYRKDGGVSLVPASVDAGA